MSLPVPARLTTVEQILLNSRPYKHIGIFLTRDADGYHAAPDEVLVRWG